MQPKLVFNYSKKNLISPTSISKKINHFKLLNFCNPKSKN